MTINKKTLLIFPHKVTKDFMSSLKNILLKKYEVTTTIISTTVAHVVEKGLERIVEFNSITSYFRFKEHCDIVIRDPMDVEKVAIAIASFYIKVKAKFTDNLDITKQWLAELDAKGEKVAFDWETKGLMLPEYNELTMVAFSTSYTEGFNITFKNTEVRDYVLNWLIETNLQLIAHNAQFELQFIYFYTGKFPKNIECSALLSACYVNHSSSIKRMNGLKHLGKSLYRDWANSKESFELYVDSTNYTNTDLVYYGESEHTAYNLPLIYYNCIDTCATMLVYDRFDIEKPVSKTLIMPTSEPKENIENFNPRDYYEQILKPALPFIVEMTSVGQSIDLSKVDALKIKVDNLKASKMLEISENSRVMEFHKIADTKRINNFTNPIKEVLTLPNIGLYKDTVDTRTFLINYYLNTTFSKVTVNDLKYILKYYNSDMEAIQVLNPIKKRTKLNLSRILKKKQYSNWTPNKVNYNSDLWLCFSRGVKKKKIEPNKLVTNLSDSNKRLFRQLADLVVSKKYDHTMLMEANNQYEWDKSAKSNITQNRIDKLNNPHKYINIGFNPFNYVQLKDMWIFLGLESDEISKDTGEMSFASGVLAGLSATSSGDLKKVIDDYLEISSAKNILTQYIPKYYGSTVNGRLKYSLKLFGTKSARLSGKAPSLPKEDPYKHKCGANGVTQPVGHKVYGSNIKAMFIAPRDKILMQVDYNGLENHINACLTKDETMIKLLNKDKLTGLGYDLHTLHSSHYFTKDWEELIGTSFKDTIQTNNQLYELTNSKTPKGKKAKKLRAKSKGVTFGLAYGAFPKKIAKQIDCSTPVATEIFKKYHNILYPGVTAYREKYVLPTCKKEKRIHLNWGMSLATEEAKKDIRTLNNATFQSYSVLTQIAGVRFREEIIKKGYQNRVKGINIIHDALYYEVDLDASLIKWVNDTLIEIMIEPFLINQTVQLKAEMDIGFNQAEVITINNNATTQEINEVLKQLKEN